MKSAVFVWATCASDDIHLGQVLTLFDVVEKSFAVSCILPGNDGEGDGLEYEGGGLKDDDP